jgi:hypothetical protein
MIAVHSDIQYCPFHLNKFKANRWSLALAHARGELGRKKLQARP